MTIYYLTCANKQEADAITAALLEAHLVACVRQLPVTSSYWWDGKIEHDTEILLMMESTALKFTQIESIVSQLHSYDEPVLTMVAVEQTTPGVEAWLKETLQ